MEPTLGPAFQLSDIAEARTFMELASRAFASTPHVEVHSLVPRPAGPHPRGSFEALFRREAFADYVSWLMFERPPRISIVIHPLTRSKMLDQRDGRCGWANESRSLARSSRPRTRMPCGRKERGEISERSH